MLNRIVIAWLAVTLAVMSVSACKTTSTHTKIDGTWKSPQFQGPGLNKLLVVGAARTQSSRELYETVMVEAVRQQGAEAEASFVAVGESKRLTRSQLRTAIEQGGFDGIVFTHVLDVEDRLKYHEGTTTQVPTSNADLYMMDYDQRYETVTTPGYYETQATYNIETIIYNAKTGQKLWWAVSETINPDSVEQAIDEIADATAKRMKDEGVIR
jgi:hypothetical protein